MLRRWPGLFIQASVIPAGVASACDPQAMFSPSDQYEMTRAFTAGAPEPILFVSLKRCPESFATSFGTFTDLGMQSVTLVAAKTRMVHFCRLAEYKGEPAPAPEAPAP
jgi:hypothetical protein